MAASRNLQGTLEQIEDSELLVASDLAYAVQVILPPVDDGSGATVDNNQLVTIAANSTGGVEVLDNLGRRVWYVRPRTAVILKSTDAADGTPRWVMERPALQEAAKITDLSASNIATAVAASALALDTSDTYAKAAVDLGANAALDALAASIEAETSTIFGEVEDKINLMIRALLIGGGFTVDKTPNAGTTLALADTDFTAAPQAVSDARTIVTSARAITTRIALPTVTAAGTGASVTDGHNIRIEANSTGDIIVEDNYGRFVGLVQAGTFARVQSSLDPNRPWQFMRDGGFEIPLGRSAFGGGFSITRLDLAAAGFDAPAAYTDAEMNTAIDAGVDALLADADAQVDAAFDEVDAVLNAILLTLEGADLVAES